MNKSSAGSSLSAVDTFNASSISVKTATSRADGVESDFGLEDSMAPEPAGAKSINESIAGSQDVVV